MRKYKLTDETTTIVHCGAEITLHRIQALRDFCHIKAGDLGGFVESEANLSHEGDCWIYGYAEVYGNADIYGNAEISGYAEVYGNAEIYGNAKVSGYAEVYGNATVGGNARVFGNAEVSGSSKVCGDTVLDAVTPYWAYNL